MDRYWERVDRNLGVITREEQLRLYNTTVAIAGCGGMGGLIAATLARIGVGRIKLADNQDFDLSNLNRQYAAKLATIGQNKAASTYREVRSICDDVQVDYYPEGVTEANVAEFVGDANVVCDEIEFFETRARVLLHRAARKRKLKVFNCNVVGFGTRIFLFTPDSMTVEEFLEIDENTVLTDQVVWRLVQRLAPRLPEDISQHILQEWVLRDHKAPIFGGTPPISSGIVVDRLCLEVLGLQSRPWITPLPPMPAYAYFDAGKFEAGVHIGKWW